jgi:hypothetical protein
MAAVMKTKDSYWFVHMNVNDTNESEPESDRAPEAEW